MTRLVAFIPLVLSIVGLVLSSLCLFAGNRKGFMEEYAIARVNITGLGHDLIDTSQDSGGDGDGGILSGFVDGAGDAINDLIGKASDDVVEALGISDWYSLHIMDACEGYFKPNATVDSPSLNITSCTNSAPDNRLNLTALIERKLDSAPVDVNLSDLGWSSSVQEQLDKVNDALFALFVMYAMVMGFSGLSMLAGALGVAVPSTHGNRLVVVANLGLASLDTLVIMIASIIVTVAVTKGVDEINDKAGDIGISVAAGTKFLILTWVTAVLTLAVTLFWAARLVVNKRRAAAAAAEESKMSY
ncbi:Ca2+ regulator and membrane fusion protein Fig1 [Geosmithia morbida]|uniref:Ca2+ regulator and membrane fusion protein Fig1 n=1 Tax=Geosmithia morbida TaxID=1094350 RepID=A0A9P4Z1H7_9HYPO|nr:Ca2+ regulator and membrane fusion protein Fig1 [Geosmithia morbida]KAF4126855.1 Ca2+ regulator and membrane fusion protein Fig1 [Geosmithia morbida]